ncbi:diguanylate cyclase domain-containing protein [Massilia sp. TSP1-1-2]|uniref:diguanylate cyclase domain-containing protein n=1 Tax=Massilia sp. TSP1-1-2 TaxID=2804649 RepID=UPI003CEDFEA1
MKREKPVVGLKPGLKPGLEPPALPQLHLLPILLSGAITLLGLLVLSGWLLHLRVLVEFGNGMVAMVVNTALCFTLAGIAILLPALLRRPMPDLRNMTGAALSILGALILFEHVFDRNLGIDWTLLQDWLLDGNIRPGRMAPNTAVGFILSGACLILMTRIASKAQERLFQILIFCVATIGLTGLVGYTLAPEQLFGWARSARMALHTAAAMLALAVAMWSSWHHLQRGEGTRYFGLDDRIGFMSAAILCVSTFTAGMTGFVFQQTLLEGSLRDKLQSRLDGQRRVIYTVVTQARTAAEHAGGDRELTAHAAVVAGGNASEADKTLLMAEMDDLVRARFLGAALWSVQGKLLYAAGATVPPPGAGALALPGHAHQTAALVWDQEIMLDTSIALLADGKAYARLDLRQRLPILQTQLFDLRGLGETGEIVICAGRVATLVCLPSGRQKATYTIKRVNIARLPLPMSLAVDGKEGLLAMLDYKGNNVMAAYAPLSDNLGLVVKQDSIELYSVVRTQLKLVIPVLLLLLLGGALLMRMQIRPLVARLIRSERQARDKQLEMNALVGSVGEGIVTMNEQGMIESFNQAAASIFGYAPAEVIGKSMQLLMPPEMRQAHHNGMRNYLSTGKAKVIGTPNVELPGLRKDGTRFTLELTVNEIQYDSRRAFVGIVRDITERKQVEAKLIHLAQYDALTGLPNRALFMDRLAGATLRANRANRALAVLFLDLDGFKKINDTLGHHSGDELLRKFGERLSLAVRKSDTVARLAGDEFTIILEELSDPQTDTRAVADKIIGAMRHPFDLADGSVSVTTSIGIAIHAGAGANVEELLRKADDAMYRAKFSGKNRWSN